MKRIVDEKRFTAKGVIGFSPENRIGSADIGVYGDDNRVQPTTMLHHVRQQAGQQNNRPNASLADFIAPQESGIEDYIGGFAVTTGIGAQAFAEEFEANHDDYNSIMVKGLADRLAEAFAECMHQRVRKEYRPYAADETLNNDELIKEGYNAIRPAPGYPACPDHTEKAAL